MIGMGTGIRAQASQARQRMILDAALDLFLDKGFGATTLDQILERSDASVGSFYHHFQSKVDVAAALYLETLESYQSAFLKELRRQREARSGIEGSVRHHLRWTAENPNLAAYLTHCREPEVAAASEARARELNRAFFDQAAAWLARHVKEKRVRRLSPDLYYALWIGPADEFTRQWLLREPRDASRLANAADVLAKAAWQSLRAPTVRPRSNS